MNLTIQAAPVPLRTDDSGAVRVGDSQVLLDVVVREFHKGARPEEIAEAYSTLKLVDVYSVIAHYLRNRIEIDEYLNSRREQSEKLRQQIEASRPSEPDLRAKLTARKAQLEQGHASARQ